jgi:hypothetical protein
MATIRSTPPGRPRCARPRSPAPRTMWAGPGCSTERCSAPLTGTPIRKIALANIPLALAEPEPFTLAKLDHEVVHGGGDRPALSAITSVIPAAAKPKAGTHEHRASRAERRRLRPVFGQPAASLVSPLLERSSITGIAWVEQKLLHVPGAGRAALGAQAAVQADVLVLHHDATGRQVPRDVERLVEIRAPALSGGAAQIGLLAVLGEGDAVGGADVDAGVALDAGGFGEHRLHVAVQAALRLASACWSRSRARPRRGRRFSASILSRMRHA